MSAGEIAKGQHTCPRCSGLTKWNGLCSPCMMAEFEGDDEEDCWQCAGDGFTYDCFEEWACVDPEGGCDLCMTRCDVCSPARNLQENPGHE